MLNGYAQLIDVLDNADEQEGCAHRVIETARAISTASEIKYDLREEIMALIDAIDEYDKAIGKSN